MRRSVNKQLFMEGMCLMNWQYVKTAALIKSETAPNSEGTVTENLQSNQFCIMRTVKV